MLHKDFTAANLKSKYLKTSIYAGTPRHPVSSYVDAETEAKIEDGAAIEYYTDRAKTRETDHLTHWIVENLLDVLVLNLLRD